MMDERPERTGFEKAVMNRELAQVLGWRVERRVQPAPDGTDYPARWYPVPPPGMKSPDGLRDVLYFGCAREWEVWQLLPDFYGSLEVAWELIAGIDGAMLCVDNQFSPNARFECSIPDDPAMGEYVEYLAVQHATTPAEAICRAFLAMKGATP